MQPLDGAGVPVISPRDPFINRLVDAAIGAAGKQGVLARGRRRHCHCTDKVGGLGVDAGKHLPGRTAVMRGPGPLPEAGQGKAVVLPVGRKGCIQQCAAGRAAVIRPGQSPIQRTKKAKAGKSGMAGITPAASQHDGVARESRVERQRLRRTAGWSMQVNPGETVRGGGSSRAGWSCQHDCRQTKEKEASGQKWKNSSCAHRSSPDQKMGECGYAGSDGP